MTGSKYSAGSTATLLSLANIFELSHAVSVTANADGTFIRAHTLHWAKSLPELNCASSILTYKAMPVALRDSLVSRRGMQASH